MSAAQLPTDPAGADPGGMLPAVLAAPSLWAEGVALAEGALPPRLDAAGPVAVLGMGGSGIVADVAATLATEVGSAPVVPVKDRRPPAWVGEGTLVVAVSHSGDTAETVAASRGALEAGARLLAVTSGGRLGALMREAGAPVVAVPDRHEPRAALPLLAGPALLALVRAGVLPQTVADDLGSLPDHLRPLVGAWGPDAADPPPLALARELVGATGWFVGARGVGALVAQRARCQLNENAERIAHASELPELDHNEIVGWAGGGPATGPLVLVELHEEGGDPRAGASFAATRDVAAGRFRGVVRHRLPGPTPLARLAAGVLDVDLASVYLALLTGVDPTPVGAIDAVKGRLGGAGSDRPATATTGGEDGP